MNVYYGDTEDTGLEQLGEIYLDEPDYSFYILAIWVDPETGVFYGASDSGCSCPSPFETYQSKEDLDNLGTNPHRVRDYIAGHDTDYESPADLISAVMNWKKA